MAVALQPLARDGGGDRDFGRPSAADAARRSPRQVLIASSRAYDALRMPAMALRENILVDFPIDDVVSGSRLRSGSGVEMVAMFRCEPCGRLDRHQPKLQARVGSGRGLLARVTHGGLLRQGDAMQVVGLPPSPLWSDDWRERVLRVVELVPPGSWVSYGRLAELAGVSAGHCRAFPRLLAAGAAGLAQRAGPADAAAVRGAPWEGCDLHDTVLADWSHGGGSGP